MTPTPLPPTVHPVPDNRLPEAAAFIVRVNGRPDGRVRCLHAEHGRSAADHLQEIQDLLAGGGLLLGAFADDGTLVGVCGADVDADRQRRAWVRGPLLDGAADPDAAAGALLTALHDALPGIQRFDAFPQDDEAPLREWLARAGYAVDQYHHVLQLNAGAPGSAAASRPDGVALADARQAEEAGRLHESLFPQGYFGAADVAGFSGAHRRLFVTPAGDAPVDGYLIVQQEPPEDGAYIDFLGVAESARGRGRGRALLQAAVHWALVERGLPSVSLTVRSDRAPAMGLYAGAGFVHEACGAHMVRQR